MSQIPPTVSFEGYLAVSLTNRKNYPNTPGMWRTSARLSKGKPVVGKDEVAVKLSVELPASLFTVPQIEARIKVADGQAPPLKLDLQVTDNIEQLILQQTGFAVKLVVPEPTP